MNCNFPENWTLKTSKNYCLRVADGTHGTPKPVREGKYLITSKNIKRGRVNFDNSYFISQNDFDEINKRSKVDQWDVLFAMIGTVGEIALVKKKPDFSIKNIGLFKSKSKVDGVWLYYYLTSSVGKAALDTYLSGTSQQFVALGDLRKVPIINPTNTSKQKIAAVLSTYDDLIENNKRRITLLEKMAEEIYREWFVRMRFPGHKKVKFVRGVPEGWEVSTLGKMAHITMGQSPKSEFYNELGDGLLFNQGVGTFGDRFPKKITFCSVKGRQAIEDDILFSVRAPVGRLNIADCEMTIGRGLAAIKHKKKLNSYLFYFLKVAFSNEDIIGNGTIFNSVGKDELSKFKMYQPDPRLVLRFENLSSPIDKQISYLIHSVQNLISTRDLLLGRLISGKLSVENLDIQFPPSMQENMTPEKPEAVHA